MQKIEFCGIIIQTYGGGFMYQCRYSFWDDRQFPNFKNHLNTLERESKKYYKNHVPDGISQQELNNGSELIQTFLSDYEFYLLALLRLGIATNDNFSTIFESLKKLSLIKVLPPDFRKYYGLTVNHKISINSHIPPKGDLNDSSMKQLIISHELGHIINEAWIQDAKQFARELYQMPRVKSILQNMGLDSSYYLECGFSFIDEVVAEEVAERVSYYSMQRERPPMEYRQDKAIFNYQPYLTNYAFYGEFQESAISFARSLHFLRCRKDQSSDAVMKRLVIHSFDKNFIRDMKQEILSSPDKLDDFIIMLACMGKMKDATYQILGLSANQTSLDVRGYADSLRMISEKYVADDGECIYQKKKS